MIWDRRAMGKSGDISSGIYNDAMNKVLITKNG